MDVLTNEAGELILAINRFIINPIILIVFTIAIIVFMYGLVEFIAKADSEEGRKTGQRHIMYGLIGLFVMFTVFGIIRFILTAIGVSPEDTLIFF